MLFFKPHLRQKIYSLMSHNQMRLHISQVLQEKVSITDFIFYDQCVQILVPRRVQTFEIFTPLPLKSSPWHTAPNY